MYQVPRSSVQATIPFLKKAKPSLALELRNQALNHHTPVMALPLESSDMEFIIDTLYEYQNPNVPSTEALNNQSTTSVLMMDWLNSYSMGPDA